MKRTVNDVSLVDRAACSGRLLFEVLTGLAAEDLAFLRRALGRAASHEEAGQRVQEYLESEYGGPTALHRAVGPLTCGLTRRQVVEWLDRTGLAAELYRDVALALLDPA